MGLKLLGELLVEAGFCSSKDIEEALSLQSEIQGRIGTVLLNSGVISEIQLYSVLSTQLQVPLFSDLNIENYSTIELANIPQNFLFANRMFPFKEDQKEISIAVDDIFKLEAIAFLQEKTQKDIKLYFILSDEKRQFENQFELEHSESIFDADEDEIDKLKELASEAPVIKLVNNIFSKSIKQRASDIHYESYKNGIMVRFRIDGKLREIDSIPTNLKLATIARLKLISKMNISENRLPQDGRISLKISGQEFDVRSSSVPTAFGESFVLRLLGKESISYSLEKLHFFPDTLSTIRDVSKSPNGIFLTTGPTGSGKTTTLYSLLNELNQEDTKIITVEDPVEYELNGISQIHVKQDIGFTFANALRSILRQDPDIIMIGEIRDLETAQIAIQAALTGHLVISTLHTNSALGAITRLLDMGVDYFLLRSSVVGLMAQRLVRKLCDHCKTHQDISLATAKKFNLEEISEKFNIDSPQEYKPVGCTQCGGTGFLGRIPIVEICEFNDDIKDYFQNETTNDITKFNFRSIYEDGILKAFQGKTTFQEISSIANEK